MHYSKLWVPFAILFILNGCSAAAQTSNKHRFTAE